TVTDRNNIDTFAELGVIFLLFSIGLEFSFRKLQRLGNKAAIISASQIFVMMLLSLFIGSLLGWSRTDSFVLGAMLSVSSTMIVLKALEDAGLKSQGFAQTVFAVLIVEDLVAIGFII